MNWSDIPFRPSTRTLRQFAVLWIVFLAGISYWHAAFRGPWLLASALGIGIGLIGLATPRLIRPVFVGWMIAVFPIGWMVSCVLLACVFCGVFAPVGLCFRLVGRDVLEWRYKPGKVTYWTRKNYRTDLARYFRQF
jgi:hypothetical protein